VNDAEIIFCDMGELRAARAVTHRPDVFGGRPQSFVHSDIAMLIHLHFSQLKAEPVRVRPATRRYQKVGNFESTLSLRILGVDSHPFAGASLDLANLASE
jgi:hypothetical protein